MCWMLLWSILSLAVLVLAVAGTLWLVCSLGARDDRSRSQVPPADPAQEELRRRYAPVR